MGHRHQGNMLQPASPAALIPVFWLIMMLIPKALRWTLRPPSPMGEEEQPLIESFFHASGSKS